MKTYVILIFKISGTIFSYSYICVYIIYNFDFGSLFTPRYVACQLCHGSQSFDKIFIMKKKMFKQ